MQKSNISDKIYWMESIVTFDYSQEGCKFKQRAISKGRLLHSHSSCFACLEELGALLVNSLIERAWQLFLLFFRSEIHLIQKWWTKIHVDKRSDFSLENVSSRPSSHWLGKKLSHAQNLSKPQKNISEKIISKSSKLKPETKKRGNNFPSTFLNFKKKVQVQHCHTLGSSPPPKKKNNPQNYGQVSEWDSQNVCSNPPPSFWLKQFGAAKNCPFLVGLPEISMDFSRWFSWIQRNLKQSQPHLCGESKAKNTPNATPPQKKHQDPLRNPLRPGYSLPRGTPKTGIRICRESVGRHQRWNFHWSHNVVCESGTHVGNRTPNKNTLDFYLRIKKT